MPLCRRCADEGVARTAEVIDHMIPLAHGDSDDDANTQPLRKEHHEAETRRDMSFRAKPTFGADGWPVDG